MRGRGMGRGDVGPGLGLTGGDFHVAEEGAANDGTEGVTE